MALTLGLATGIAGIALASCASPPPPAAPTPDPAALAPSPPTTTSASSASSAPPGDSAAAAPAPAAAAPETTAAPAAESPPPPCVDGELVMDTCICPKGKGADATGHCVYMPCPHSASGTEVFRDEATGQCMECRPGTRATKDGKCER